MHKVLVTGSNGFLGKALVNQLGKLKNHQIRCVIRSRIKAKNSEKYVLIKNIDGNTDWSNALEAQTTVIHTAARAHVMKENTNDQIDLYRSTNVEGTLKLAQQAAVMGVKRFIFISSIKVCGEHSKEGMAFSQHDMPNPQDAYGRSKLEAELGLMEINKKTKMEVVIIRPPLIYGSGVKGNFSQLMKIIQRGIPLPFGSINNKRSLIGLDNLIDLIVTCIDHPNAAGQTLLASDGQDLSTTELLSCLAQALDMKPRLIKIPQKLLMNLLKLLGKEDVSQRLFGSLQVDITRTRELLDWSPPFTVAECMHKAFSKEVKYDSNT